MLRTQPRILIASLIACWKSWWHQLFADEGDVLMSDFWTRAYMLRPVTRCKSGCRSGR